MTSWFASFGWAAVGPITLVALLGLGGCGGGGGGATSAGGASTPPAAFAGPAPRAYAETHFVRHPNAVAKPEHVIMVRLEASGIQAGDTGEPGIDRIPYVFDRAANLTLSIHASATQLGRLVLVSSTGETLTGHERGSSPESKAVAPGNYMLELHHAQRGSASPQKQTLFVRNAASAGSADVELSAGSDCPQCDFSYADLQAQDFDDKDFTGAIFRGALLADSSLRGAVLRGADFTSMVRVPGFPTVGVDGGTLLERTDFSRSPSSGKVADLTGAILDGVYAPNANFREANLSNTFWRPRQGLTEGYTIPYYAQLQGADFTDARLTGATIRNVNFTSARFQGADLSGATLQNDPRSAPAGNDGLGWGLAGADFTRSPVSGRVANLSRASLQNADLSGVDFVEADFSGAQMAGTLLRGADLTRARLAGAQPAGLLGGQDLTGTNLSGLDFSGQDLSQANLSNAILSTSPMLDNAKLSDGVARGVNLSGQAIFPTLYAGFKGRDLRFVNLSNVSLYQANLEGANLSNAQLIGTNLSYASLKGAKLVGAQLGVAPGGSRAITRLQGAYMPDADLTDADLRSADLTDAHLYSTTGSPLRLTRTRLDSTVFVNAVLAGTAFDGSLNDASFSGALLVAADFSGANLTNAKFDSAHLQGTSFLSAASVTGVSLNNAAVATAPGGWTYTEQDGTSYTYSYDATQLGTIATSNEVTCPNSASGPCTSGKLVPVNGGPFPPVPACIPQPPDYDNCQPPRPD